MTRLEVANALVDLITKHNLDVEHNGVINPHAEVLDGEIIEDLSSLLVKIDPGHYSYGPEYDPRI